MSDKTVLKAEKRDGTGKGVARNLRQGGRVRVPVPLVLCTVSTLAFQLASRPVMLPSHPHWKNAMTANCIRLRNFKNSKPA